MSPLDLLRRVRADTAASSAGGDSSGLQHGGGVAAVRAAVRGVVAGLITLLPILLLGSALWLTTADMPLTWTESMRAGMSFWLLGHGIPIMLASGPIGIVPLAMLLALMWVGVWSAGRATWSAAEHGWRPALAMAAAWAGGYASLMATAGGLAVLGPMPLHVLRWIVAVLVLPLLMAIVGMVRSLDHDDVDDFLERLFVPAAVRRAWRPALHTSAVIVGAGTFAAVVAVGLSIGDVLTLQQDLRPGLAGGLTLALIQLLALPNIGLWLTSFVAGPGFSIVEGASVTWEGSTTALVPMVPVFAAHPQPAEFPGATPILAGALVLLGGWLGWQSLAATARLASLRAKALTMVSAVAATGLLIGLLDWVGGGSLGVDRLAQIGAPAALLGLAVTGWLLLGAALVLLWDWRTLDA